MPRKKTPDPPPKPKRRPPGTGSVIVRADGRIAVRLPKDLDPAQRPIYGPGKRQRFTSVDQATRWLDAEIARHRNPTSRSATLAEPLGAYLLRWYRNHEPGWPAKTASAYKLGLGRWVTLRHVPLGELTREVVQGGIADLQRMTWTYKDKDGHPTSEPRPYSRRTIAQAQAILHQALDDLIPDVLAHNPATSRRRSSATADAEQPVWTGEQVERFLIVATRMAPDLEPGYRLILRRALRIGELVALEWSDLDDHGRTLRIDESAVPNSEESGPTKTRTTRDIPLSMDLVARLTAHRRAYPSTRPFMFVRDGRRISVDTLRNVWNRIALAARVPRIAPKDGRATCATLLLDAGQPLPRVSQLLGHSNVATTARFYARVLKRRAEQIAELGEEFDQALTGRPAPDSEEQPAL